MTTTAITAGTIPTTRTCTAIDQPDNPSCDTRAALMAALMVARDGDDYACSESSYLCDECWAAR